METVILFNEEVLEKIYSGVGDDEVFLMGHKIIYLINNEVGNDNSSVLEATEETVDNILSSLKKGYQLKIYLTQVKGLFKHESLLFFLCFVCRRYNVRINLVTNDKSEEDYFKEMIIESSRLLNQLV